MNDIADEASPESQQDDSLPHGESSAGQHSDSPPPVQAEQEWANAWTHGIAAVLTLGFGGWMTVAAAGQETGLGIAVGAYIATVFGTFACSTLSHCIFVQPWLNRFRAWDQAMIYLMITGTYTPIVYGCAGEELRRWLLAAIWVAAVVGFVSKTILQHRINSIGTVSYLLLGWLPAIPLAGRVPSGLGYAMLIGGVLYSLGVVVLVNDKRIPYLHALWHLFVMAAAAVHMLGIYRYVISP